MPGAIQRYLRSQSELDANTQRIAQSIGQVTSKNEAAFCLAMSHAYQTHLTELRDADWPDQVYRAVQAQRAAEVKLAFLFDECALGLTAANRESVVGQITSAADEVSRVTAETKAAFGL